MDKGNESGYRVVSGDMNQGLVFLSANCEPETGSIYGYDPDVGIYCVCIVRSKAVGAAMRIAESVSSKFENMERKRK